MGRPRLPKQAKIIRGTFRSSREPDAPEIPPLPDVPKAPSWLGPYAAARWRELARDLTERGILTALDLPCLEATCSCYQLWRDAHDAIYRDARGRRRTLASYMRGGNSQTRPLVVVVKQALALYKGYLQEFGLSPSSRGKVHAEPQKPAEVDPMLALLDGD